MDTRDFETGFWQLYMNHIQIMKEKFPKTNGRICSYCLKEYSFIRRMGPEVKGMLAKKNKYQQIFQLIAMIQD